MNRLGSEVRLMNISRLISTVKMDLGLLAVNTVFKQPIEEVVHEIVSTKTIPIFSLYCPLKEGKYINLSQLQQVRISENSVYGVELILPNSVMMRKLLYVTRIDYTEDNANVSGSMGNSYYGYGFDTFDTGFGHTNLYGGHAGIYGLANSTQLAQAADNLLNVMTKRMTFRYIEPNRLRIFNSPAGHQIFYVTFAYEHDPNCETIPDSAYQSFLELAELDIKATLYQSMKYYHNLNSAYGQIDLKIDEWSNAENERKEVIRGMKERFHISQFAENWS